MDFTSPLLNLYKKYGEPALQLAAAAPAEMLGGLAGLVTGNPNNVRKVSDYLQQPFQAQSPQAKKSLNDLAGGLASIKKTMVDDNPPVNALVNGYNNLNDYVGDRSPLLGAAMKTLPTAAGMFLAPGSAPVRDAFASAGRGALSAGEQAMRNASAVPAVRGALSHQRGSIGVEKPFVYPQEHALETARKNAVEMLGLSENNTAMDRAKALGFSNKDYIGSHHAPLSSSNGAPLYDMSKIYPEDIYSSKAGSYYGDGVNAAKDVEIAKKIQSFRNSPEKQVTIFRAAPKDAGNSLNHGDWVTLDKQYAIDHGERTLDGNYKIISDKVPAKTLFNEGNSLYEFGLDKTQNFSDYPTSMKTMIGLDKNKTPFERVKFAAFDPARVNENDLLGAATPEFLKYLAGGTATGLAAPYAYDQYKKYFSDK